MQPRTPECSTAVARLFFLCALAMSQLAVGQIAMTKGDRLDVGGLEGALKGGGADALVAALSAMHSDNHVSVIPKHVDENGEEVYDFTTLQKEWTKKDEPAEKPPDAEAVKPVVAPTSKSPALLKKSASTSRATLGSAGVRTRTTKTVKIKSAHAKAAVDPAISDGDDEQSKLVEDSDTDEMAPPGDDGAVESSEPASSAGNNKRIAPQRPGEIAALWHGLRALRTNIGALVDESGALVNRADTQTSDVPQTDSKDYKQALNKLTALAEQNHQLEMQLQAQANETKKFEAQLQAQNKSKQSVEEQLVSQGKEIHALEVSEKEDHEKLLLMGKTAVADEAEIKAGRRKLAKMVKAAQMAKAAAAAAQQAAQAAQQDSQDSPDEPPPDPPQEDHSIWVQG